MCTCQMCKSEQREWVSMKSCETENVRMCYWKPCEINKLMLPLLCLCVHKCLESMLGIISENECKIAWLLDSHDVFYALL